MKTSNRQKTNQNKTHNYKPRKPKDKQHSFEWKQFFIDHKWLFLILAITLLIFVSALNNQFIHWDDNDYVIDNLYIRDFSLNGIITLFTVYVSAHYHPITLLSYAIDYKIWGLMPMGYILTNIFFHILNTFIIYQIFLKITKYKEIALITALLFAIHPMKVESVVWISARKDVLFAFFYLLAVYRYVLYISYPKRISILLSVIGFFILSLLSKGTAVSLPMVLLLLDFFCKRKDFKRILIEKLPFFVLSIAFGLLAVTAQSDLDPNMHPFKHHFFLVTYAITFYIVKFFAPLYQSPLFEFPHKTNDLLPTLYYFSALIIPLGVFCIYFFKSIRNELLFTLLFFGFTIGLFFIKFPIGPFYLAERYTYLPYVGLAYLIGFLYMKHKIAMNLKDNVRNPFFVGLIIFALLFSFKTYSQIKVWRNSLVFFQNLIDNNPKSAVAYYNRASYKQTIEDYTGAIDDFNETLKIRPDLIFGYFRRAQTRFNIEDYENALHDFDKALELKPNYAEAYYNKAVIYNIMGNYEGVISTLNLTIDMGYNLVHAYNLRGLAKSRLLQFEDAIYDFNQAIALNNNMAEAFNNRGFAKSNLRQFKEAIQDYNEALRITPNVDLFLINRGISFYYLEDFINACTDWEAAYKLGNQDALSNLSQFCND